MQQGAVQVFERCRYLVQHCKFLVPYTSAVVHEKCLKKCINNLIALCGHLVPTWHLPDRVAKAPQLFYTKKTLKISTFPSHRMTICLVCISRRCSACLPNNHSGSGLLAAYTRLRLESVRSLTR